MPVGAAVAARVARRGRTASLPACLAVVAWLASAGQGAGSEDAIENPVLNDEAAIGQGRSFYRRRCIICHGHAGGRGPNLFASELSDEQFLEVVINGRKGTLMPAFGARMSPDEVWTVHAFVKSRDRY